MFFEISEEKLEQLLEIAAERGALSAIEKTRVRKTHVSQREAYRMCGISNISRWRREGKIKPTKKGKMVLYPVAGLESLSKINELTRS